MATTAIATNITIGGHLLSSFGGAIRNSKLGLMSLQSTAIKVNSSITGIGKGLLGLGGSFLAFEGIKSFLMESVKLSKEAGATTAALTAIVTNQNKLRGIGAEQSKAQVEAIERQSKALMEQTGIYKEIFTHGAATLSQYKLSLAQIKMLQPAMADLMTYQRQMGIDSGSDYDSIGKALMGFPRGLKAMGIEFTKLQLKQFEMLSQADKLRMIYLEIERQHGGAGAKFGESLAGQAVRAKFHWMETMTTIGDSWKPILQKTQIFWGSMADIIGPPLIKLSKFVAEQFDSWVKIIKDSVIPVIRSIVQQGWNYLSAGITFFKSNSGWLLPWIGEAVKIIGLWTFVIGPLVQAIGALRLAMMGLSLSNPFTAIALAAGVAAYFIITRWTEVKRFFAGLWEMIAGTKVFNSSLEDKGVLRAFKKGEVPRAMPVQLGWIGEATKAWKTFIDTMPKDVKDALGNIQKDWSNLVQGVQKDWNTNIAPWLLPAWQKIIEALAAIRNVWLTAFVMGVELVIKGVSNLLDVVIKIRDGFKDAFGWFSKLNPPGPNQGPYKPGEVVPGRVPGSEVKYTGNYRGWTSGLFGNTDLPSPPKNAQGYKTYEEYSWEKARDSHIGPSGNVLALNKGVGLGKNVASEWRVQQGDWINIQGLGWRQLNEASSRKNGIEIYTDKRDSIPERLQIMGVRRIKRNKDGTTPDQGFPTSSTSNAPVNITYTVTNHIHGDVEHKVAALHAKHIEQMKKDIEEAEYMKHRARLV
jgi:hypothetical protein